jgi:hypothetical protein
MRTRIICHKLNNINYCRSQIAIQTVAQIVIVVANGG